MANEKLGILFEVEGGSSIDKGSGQLISKQLRKIADNISNSEGKRPKITVDLNSTATSQKIQNQLKSIVNNINLKNTKLDIGTDNISKSTKKDVDKAKKEIESLVKLASSSKLKDGFEKTKIDLNKFGLFDDKDISKKIIYANKIFEDIANKQISYNENSAQKAEIAGLVTEYKTLEKEINDVIKTKKRLTNDDSVFLKEQNKLQGYINNIKSYLQNNGRISGTEHELQLKNIVQDAEKLYATARNGGQLLKTDVDNINRKFLESKNNIKSLGLEGQSFAQRFTAQLEKLGIYITGAFVVMGAFRQFKQMITTIKELDQVVTDLSVATGYNRQKTKELLDTYSQLGKELGATTVDVGKASDAWLRQGYSINETNKLIKDSMMLSKLGQIDSSEATTALTATMKGYGISVADATTIVDKFTAVDKEAAVSAGGIATAMQETATGARLAGVDINRLTGYIASVAEVTQDGAESIGVFYKTLFARMGNIKSGKLVDPETQEDLSDTETTLNNLGIKLRENGGEFKNFGVVLDEVYAKWDKLGSVNQRAIAVAFAGYRVA